MKFIAAGIIAGCLLGLVHLVEPAGGSLILPEWQGSVDRIEAIEPSPDAGLLTREPIALRLDSAIALVAANGALLRRYDVPEGRLAAMSGNGKFFAEYEKVGRTVEFCNIEGERFWKLKSLEYPYLSQNGRTVLLMNGDHSAIRVFDYNGNQAPAGSISGRFCTAIAFAPRSDCAALGFLDGGFHVLNAKGEAVYRGSVPKGCVVKGMAVSDSGAYCAVHWGGQGRDYVFLVDIARNDVEKLALAEVHLTRTALCVNDLGELAVLDGERLVVTDDDADVRWKLAIPRMRPGHASIAYDSGMFAAAFGLASGGAAFMLLDGDGRTIFSKTVPEEPFLDAKLRGGMLYLRGSRSLMAYRLHPPASR